METTFDAGVAGLRNSQQKLKGDLKDGARVIQEDASEELKNFLADVEDVMKRVANVSDVDVARVRAKIQAAIASTKSGIVSSAAGIKRQAQQAADYADEYVHESPWQAVGVGAALAALLGITIGLLASRRT